MNQQEKFWQGEFGNEYITRNCNAQIIASKTNSFAQILRHTTGIKTVCEFGANVGLNLTALNRIKPNLIHSAIEINKEACKRLAKGEGIKKILEGSITDFSFDEIGKHDLTFTVGVLIHINPDELHNVYDRLYACSNRYVLVREYFNPTPVEVQYRGHEGKLFKRDFAGELIDEYGMKLIDYGFHYSKDNNFPMDNGTWFLLEK